jgi:hypothetical protein
MNTKIKRRVLIFTSIVILILFIFSGCGTTIKNPFMTTLVMNNEPTDNVASYSKESEKLIACVFLNNASTDTEVKFLWTFVTKKQEITEATMTLHGWSNGESGYIFCSLNSQDFQDQLFNDPKTEYTFEQKWPVGDYSVEIFLNSQEKPEYTLFFRVA